MYELKKWVFTSKFVGTGPSSYEKIIYRAAVSQRLRNTDLDEWRAIPESVLEKKEQLMGFLSVASVQNTFDPFHQTPEALGINLPIYSSLSLLVVVLLDSLDITNKDVDVLYVLENASSLVKVVTPLRIKRAPTAHHDMICTQITARPERL